MVRPIKNRIVMSNPDVRYFKPRGIPIFELEEIRLAVDEREALRLADLLDMSHEEAGRHMGVSRATFGRIVQRARKTIADAIINGKAINIEGGNYKVLEKMPKFMCRKCNYCWEETSCSRKRQKCPSCNHENIYRMFEDD